MMSRTRTAAALALLTALPLHDAAANPASAALRVQGANHIYNLVRDEAAVSFRDAVAADPNDAAAYRGLATTVWLSITFRRGNMTVDDYLGRVSKPGGPPTPASPEQAAAFRDAIEKAIALSRARIE